MLAIKFLSGIAFVVSMTWLLVAPDYASTIAAVTSLSTLIAAFFRSNRQKPKITESQVVAENEICIQGAGNVIHNKDQDQKVAEGGTGIQIMGNVTITNIGMNPAEVRALGCDSLKAGHDGLNHAETVTENICLNEITTRVIEKFEREFPERLQTSIAAFLETLPSQPQRLRSVRELLQRTPLDEVGSNANGEYLRYTNGMQVCKGKFVLERETTTEQFQVVFPAQFVGAPAVELSGAISEIGAKSATSVSLLITPARHLSKRIEFEYHAAGRWSAAE